jgi:uncharacterized protein Yka (UPF0111/DUF47 family)
VRFSFMPREVKFFDMFDEVAALLTQASKRFLEMVTAFDRLPERAADLRKDERACDAVVERIIKSLDQSFITPFDREDIHSLATRLDDVMDNMEETSHRFDVFRIDRPPAAAVQMARIIHECCVHLEQAVQLCRTMREVEAIQTHIREVTRLENEADRIYRESDAGLFADPPDILLLIKLRELYGWLEETVDACKDVSLIISEILIKGS